MGIVKGATLSVALILAVSAAACAKDVVLFAAPVPDGQCMGSPAHLGTDNIPPGRSRSSTVVDISAISKTPNTVALAWVYSTLDGRMWVQANVVSRPDLLKALTGTPFRGQMDNAPVINDGSPPVGMTRQNVRQFELVLSKSGFGRQQCFSNPLPAKYTKY